MAIKAEYKVCLFDNDQIIDETCIDENNEELAWHLFKEEFGHSNLSDEAYIDIELMGFYDNETGETVIIEEVPENERIDPRDSLSQFTITYADGESIQAEARGIEEARMIAEDFNNEK